jgi:ribosomal protein L19
MHTSFNRRTATKVKDGRVQRKNRHRPTGHEGYVLDRESPGRGFRHVVTKRDVQAFIDVVPEWDRYSERLERIVLASRREGYDGEYAFYHREETGAIFLHAWREDLWTELAAPYFGAHQAVLERLGVSYDRLKERVICRFTEVQARAFMLLHVFMHELGHHYDYIHQKHIGSTKGEDYAERFAANRFEQLFPPYVRIFGDPSRAA